MGWGGNANFQIDILAADKTAAAFASVERRMKSMEQAQAVASAGLSAGYMAITRMLPQLAAGLSAAALAQRAWQAGMKAADLGEQAEQVGLNTDQLQAYRLAAAQAGVSNEQLDGGLMRFTRLMGEANAGNEEAIAKFERLNVKLLDAEGNLRKPADILPEFSRGMLGLSSETERNALMMEFMGRSGYRMVTMLGEWARGNDAVVKNARALGAITSPEAIAAWDKLADQINVAEQQFDTLFATIGAPLALPAFEALTSHLRLIVWLGKQAKGAVEWATSGGAVSLETLQARVKDEQAGIEAIRARGGDPEAMEAQIGRRQRMIDDLNRQIAEYAGRGAPLLMPPITVTAGVKNPQPRGGKDTKVKDTVDEIGELIRTIEAAQKAGETLTDRFGDGMQYSARETEKLNALLAGEYISGGVHARALADIAKTADDMARAYRGAQGGADGFIAGIEQGMADLERANSAFELGKQLVDELSDAFTDLAMGAEVDFNRILQSFLAMIIQMEMRAAASNLWNAVNGQSGGGGSMGSLGGLVVGAIGSLLGGGVSSSAPLSFGVGGSGMAGASALPGGWMPGFADGGRPPVGMPSIVGEEGPEVFWPDSAGTIIPNRALGGSGGETGDTVVVNQTMYFGSDVNQATLRTWAARIREETKADILSQRRRGAKEWKGAFG